MDTLPEYSEVAHAERPIHVPVRRPSRRLFVVSNRLAHAGVAQTGGVATALDALLKQRGGVWLGWSGRVSPSEETASHRSGNIERVSFDLDTDAHEHYYLGYANRALWPLLHSRPDLLQYSEHAFATYLRVNRRVAGYVAERVPSDAIVWLHDYHLLTVPAELKAMGLKNPIGVFLHTPVASPDLVRVLPRHRDLLGGLAAADLIGTQTERDAQHLRAYFDQQRLTSRPPRIAAFPIGVDPTSVAEAARASDTDERTLSLRESLVGRKLMIGIDRLDYSKGLPERFEAYGQLFDRHPELRRSVSYLQIAPISRGGVDEYRRLKNRLDALVGSINARHGEPDWVPLRYVARSHQHRQVMGFLRTGSVGVVTPLRDGMNLVAKEYVAAQRPEDPGVLVLSEFAGASAQMQDALLVNPLDVKQVADALASAVRMGLSERRRRWESLMQGLQSASLETWGQSFVAALEAVRSPGPSHDT